MSNTHHVICIVPHWNTPGHVGNLRNRRMIRWLSEASYNVTVIRAGLEDRLESTGFGQMITIRDPLKMHADTTGENDLFSDPQEAVIQITRKPNAFRRWLSYVLLIPDPGIVWARRMMKHPMVLDACTDAAWFLASSPPESGFIAAAHLADRFKGRFIMDLRDGWLDEPMKPLLRSSALQRWRERRLESKMIRKAYRVLVTTNPWKDLLTSRYPEAEKKTRVLTNAYPPETNLYATPHQKPEKENPDTQTIRFLYAGRIFSSRPGRRIEYLFEPMIAYAQDNPVKAEIVFMGDLIPGEEAVLEQWNKEFNKTGWSITRIAGKPHHEAVLMMGRADVLLLLSESGAALPAKFFDYISIGKPVFAAFPSGSAVALESRKVNQLYGYTFEQREVASEVFHHLMDDLAHESVTVSRPVEFEESFLKPEFMSIFQD